MLPISEVPCPAGEKSEADFTKCALKVVQHGDIVGAPLTWPQGNHTHKTYYQVRVVFAELETINRHFLKTNKCPADT